MKNGRIVLLSLACMLMALPLGGKLFAQSALTNYKCELLPMRAHVFSADAKVFDNFKDGDSICRLRLKPDGTTERLNPVSYSATKPAAKTGNASLPGDGFYFGEKRMKYFGLTGGGLVYFGETDTLRLTYNPSLVFAYPGAVEKFIFIKFYAPTGSSSSETAVLATASTSVKYEIDADTLFIAYNDVKLLNAENHAFVCSFQYALTKDGKVLFIPVSMQSQDTYYFNYGLYSENKRRMEGCFLQDLAGNVATNSYEQIMITSENYPKQTYCMYPPEPCKPVENPSVTWSYTVATDYLELHSNAMTCNGQVCLFILSTEETLSGANLPVDGTDYVTGSKIGSSIFVTKGDIQSGKLFIGSAARTATGLTPGTTYYLHAFPYIDSCSGGPRYNTTDIPKRAITTAIKPVNAVSVDASTLTENGFTLNIDKGDAERYVLAVSRRQISPFANTPLSAKEGGYKAGDKLTFSYVHAAEGVDEKYELEVLTVSADATYEVTDAQPNTDYYYYVWSTDASQTKCSFEARTCAVATPYHIPAVLAFDSAAVTQNGLTPAGWVLTPAGERSFRIVEMEGQKYLTADLYANTANAALRIETVSPVIKGGKNTAVSVEFYFWRMPSNGIEPLNASLRVGDTVYIQYKGLGENTWTTLYAVTKANAKAGNDTLTTDPFYSSTDFQLRFVAVSDSVQNETVGYIRASIRKITVDGICHAISSEPEVSQIMHDRATLSWEDEDNTPRAEAYHIRYRLSENDAWAGRISKNREFTFTGLKDNTYYTMEVAAVCSAGDTSGYVNVSFTTLHGLPYKFAFEGVTLKAGALPASGTASLTEPDEAKTVWAPMQKAGNVHGAGLTVDANLNNPLWLNLPVLSTGVLRGKARLSFKLSAWSAADATQPATFGTTDTMWLLFSTDNKFNAASAKIKVDWSEVTPQGKTYTLDFDVENPYQYWAVYTGLQTAGNVLFIDSLNIEWTEIYCNAVTNVRHSNVGYYSVDISWNGEGMEYGIFYNDRTTDKWDSVYTYETSYTLEGLTSATNYQYYIVVYCDAERLKASARSSVRYFLTEKICEVPTLEIVEGSETWQGVTVITHSNEPKRQFNFLPKGIPIDYDLYATNGKKDTTHIKGLSYILDTLNGVTYYIKVRALCANDTSDWSEAKEFTLKPTPVCHKPTGLKASVNAETQVATLSWTEGTNNLSYAVFLRAGQGRQDTILTGRTSLTTKVEPNVVYTWTMMSACEKPLYSDIVSGPSFSASVGIESVQGFDKAVKVRVFENQIIIENNQGLYIKSLQAFSVDGKLLRTYSVNSTQNAYIYHTLPKGAALLRVLGENGKTATYKTIIL